MLKLLKLLKLVKLLPSPLSSSTAAELWMGPPRWQWLLRFEKTFLLAKNQMLLRCL